MPGKVRVSSNKRRLNRGLGKPVRKRGLNRGLLLLGGSIVFILGIVLVSLLASGSSTKNASGIPSSVAAPVAPNFQLTTFDGGKYALSQDQGKVRVVFFMIAPN